MSTTIRSFFQLGYTSPLQRALLRHSGTSTQAVAQFSLCSPRLFKAEDSHNQSNRRISAAPRRQKCDYSLIGGIIARNFQVSGSWGSSTFDESMKLYFQGEAGYSNRLQKSDTRFEIAKIHAETYPDVTARSFLQFEIEEEHARIEIAKICARASGGITAECIRNFKITNQVALIEIAKVCAQKDGGETAKWIERFGIEDEDVRTEIAKKCAEGNPGETAQWIRHFKIENQDALIDIAKVCAQKNARETAAWIESFGIRDENDRIEIAKICAQSNPEYTAGVIGRFEIHSQAALNEIGIYCLFQSIYILRYAEGFLEWDQFSYGMRTVLRKLASNSFPNNFRQLLEDFVNTRLNGDPYFLKLIEQISQIEDCEVRNSDAVWLATFLYFAATLDRPSQEQMIKTQLVEILCSDRCSKFRSSLTPSFIDLCKSQRLLGSYLEQSSDGQAPERRLVNLLLLMLLDEGVAKNTIETIQTILLSSFKGRTKIQPLVEVLCRLHSSRSLPIHVKQAVLEQLCQGAHKDSSENTPNYLNRIHQMKPELRNRVYSLLTILFLEGEKELTRSVHSGSVLIPIQELAKKLLQERLHFNEDDQSISNLFRYFVTERDSSALLVYAGKLSSLNDPKVMHDLIRYIRGVVHGTFEEERYQLADNPHLQKIAHYDGSIIKRWQKALEPQDVMLDSKSVEDFDGRSWLRTKLLIDQHIDLKSIPYVRNIIAGDQVHEEYLSPLENALQALSFAISKQEQIICLKDIEEVLNKLAPCEFLNDVKGQLKAFDNHQQEFSRRVIAIDSDHYLDYLLCGTEVFGSCQNVHGSPELSKGLLGYILDGKNRLLCIKDERGRILARAKLSLLWDGKKPVLFLERLYDKGIHTPQCRQAIIDMAKKKASLLGLLLATSSHYSYPGRSEMAERDLLSLGSGVSYEYSDGARGVKGNGRYTIENAELVYIPGL
ncbi:MAG: hypothetical protein JSS61_04500 [Verrucomicrobia bacterium]|nr:hypothetical protein [Verrucomicrobiota bacterium]